MMMHLSGNIKRIRGLLGSTQKEFATMMQVTENMQKSYETGRAVPDINYMDWLVERTGIEESQLKNENLGTDYIKKMMDLVKQNGKNEIKEPQPANQEPTLTEMNERLKVILQKIDRIEVSLGQLSQNSVVPEEGEKQPEKLSPGQIKEKAAKPHVQFGKNPPAKNSH